MNYDIPPITPRLGFTVTETVRPPEPVVPDPFIVAPAAQAGGGVAANATPARRNAPPVGQTAQG